MQQTRTKGVWDQTWLFEECDPLKILQGTENRRLQAEIRNSTWEWDTKFTKIDKLKKVHIK